MKVSILPEYVPFTGVIRVGSLVWAQGGGGASPAGPHREIRKEKVKKKDKWGSIRYKQANDTYRMEMKIKSRAHHTPEPAWGITHQFAM